MNRIILIGNGFDLAHGMETSYSAFLNDFWRQTILEIQKTKQNEKFENENIIVNKVPEKWTANINYTSLKQNLKFHNSQLTFKNRFLEIITDKTYLQNWVDIEDEYYSLLKKSINTTEDLNPYHIKELNVDFERIKKALEEYLLKTEKEFDKNFNDPRIKSNIGHKIYSHLKLKDFTEKSINQKVEIEFNKISKDIKGLKEDVVSIDELNEDNKRLITRLNIDKTETEIKHQLKMLLISDSAVNYFELVPEQTLFLNFNYTFNDLLYKNQNEFDNFGFDKKTKTKFIHIHGSLIKSDKNPIIFGFGDEIDENYHSIEKLNDNRYLENIKSIKYLETDNYKKLLEFLNGGNYQIFVLGHSCGVSDRTLLNTLFEHENCASIKPYYHKKSDEEDNYSDIVRNISRNFNNKVEMRNRVVNKEYCDPLL
tara:strand:+ start:80 stop:1354 length:1275 start_codon:yes stop_codon:yes gene_type:complete